MTKTQKADQHKEQAAKLADRQTQPSRERAAHHLTAANAIKRGQAVPKATAAALRKGD